MISQEERDKMKFIQEALAKHLDTRDKRWMFLKIFFPQIVSHINLEGSALNTAFNIVQQFQQRSMLEALSYKIDEVFA